MKKTVSTLLVFAIFAAPTIMTAFAEENFNSINTSKYSYISPSDHGIREVVTESHEHGCIDEEGNVIVEPGTRHINHANGYILVHDQPPATPYGDDVFGPCTALNIKGQKVTSFDTHMTYYDGKHGISCKQTPDGVKFALTDAFGKPITPYEYDGLGVSSPEYRDCVLAEKGYYMGYLNWNGSVRLPLEYVRPKYTEESIGLTGADGEGLASLHGQLILPAKYNTVGGLNNGFAYVHNNDNFKVAFINSSGQFVTPFIFDHAMAFCEGLACVSQNGLWGYIDTNMKMVLPPRYASATDFYHGYATVTKPDGTTEILESPVKKSRNINVFINGDWFYTSAEPIMEEDRVLLPLREIGEALNYYVLWDDATKSVTLQDLDHKKGITTLTIGSTQAWSNTFDDGLPAEKQMLDVTPQLIDGKTYLPLRFLAENIDARVEWDQAGRAVRITK